jgi:very-short-patch-repair endonuclease
MRHQTATHRIAALGERQHGVVSRRQLLAAGITPAMIRIGSPRSSPWDVRRRVVDRPGLDVHRTTILPSDDVTVVAGVPVTTVARTLVDLAGAVPRDHLARALREAERLWAVDVDAIEAAAHRLRTRRGRGHAVLRAVLAEHAARGMQLTRSVLEDRFLALLAARGLPRPRTNVHIEGYEVDACWPAARLVVELDGWEHHRTRAAFERDREKANALIASGWTVLRFTHRDVAERPTATARRLATLLSA